MSFSVVEIDNLIFGADGSGTLTANNRGLLLAGKDGSTPRFLVVDATGRVVVSGAGVAGTPAGGVVSVQGVAGGVTLPVTATGTVTANQGTANTQANRWPVFLTDGTNPLGTPTAPVRIDPTGVTTQPVSGPLTDAQLRATPVPVSSAQLPAALVGGRIDANLGAWLGSTAPTVGQKAMGSSVPVAVASDQSPIDVDLTLVGGITAVSGGLAGSLGVGGLAAQGAAPVGNPLRIAGSDGSLLRTLLTDTSGRQVVVGASPDGSPLAGNPVLLGVSDGTNAETLQGRVTDLVSDLLGLVVRTVPAKKPTFIATVVDVATANNKSMLSLFLSAGATNVLRLRKVYIRNSRIAAATGAAIFFELRRATAASAGTAVTPQAMDAADAALGANITCATNATVTDGALIDRWGWSSDEWGAGTLDQEGLEHSFQNMGSVWNVGADPERDLTLRATGGVHLKCATNSTTGLFDIVFVFTQE